MNNNHSPLNQTILIDRYLIEQELSQKAGRKTFLAQDTHTKDLVIIKILQFDSFFQWDDLKLFEREAKTLKNISHSAIPKYLDYFEVDNDNIRGFALVQTYINAPSLEALIKEGRKFSEEELIELAEKLLKILTYLHGQIPPVIHRDIKPSNILLSNRSGNSLGDVYLVDFGSVETVASKDNGTITIVGSYGYMPLEQFGGQTTTASDLYSLGMTLIYLLTGSHPAELSQVNGQIKFSSSDISKKFTKWLEKMTHPHLDKRFTLAKLAIVALNSKDGSYGDFLHLRPTNSKVEVHRSYDLLKIEFPDYNFAQLKDFSIIIVVILIFIYKDGFSFSSLFFGIFIGIFIQGIFSPAIKLFFPNKPRYRIINCEQDNYIKTGYFYNQKTTKVKWDKKYSFTKDIHLLVYNPGYTFDSYLDETGRKIKRGKVTVQPKLSVHAGKSEYTIGR